MSRSVNIQDILDLFDHPKDELRRLSNSELDALVREKMPQINAITGQENDPRYFGYLIRFILEHPTKNCVLTVG